MKPIIEINNLGKKYTIVHDKAPYGTLRDTIVSFAKNPFAPRQQRETFWALKDINLNINKGDIVGIIGKNGAGKSTLLKILSGITKPTEGNIKLYGRVSSLLEVGTGFHPELTGRENIFMNGVILGMSHAEVAKKFDQIVDFAGIEKFLDTQVKHYSSGMYVRLAFAVAAHLEPDILIVDEVLAVGDAEFQKKCLGKMSEISKEEGRTVLFVSHNMGAIKTLCSNVFLLLDGKIDAYGNANEIIDRYLNNQSQIVQPRESSDSPYVSHIYIENSSLEQVRLVDNSKEFFLNVEISSEEDDTTLSFEFTIYNSEHVGLFTSLSSDSNIKLLKGTSKIRIRLPTQYLNTGSYRIGASFIKKKIYIGQNYNYLSFDCLRDYDLDFERHDGRLRIPYQWQIFKI